MASVSSKLDHVTKLNFKPEPITPFIYKLLSQKIPQNEEKTDTTNKQITYLKAINKTETTAKIYKMLQHPFIYCWITPHSIIGNKIEFKFKFNLYIDDDNKHNPSVYNYIFNASFNDIKTLYIKALTLRKYFPVQKLPTLLPETLKRRSDKLKEDLIIMDEYSFLEEEMKSIDGIYICKGPGKKHWWTSEMREANNSDIETLSYILCKLFNSPAYCYEDNDFNIFMSKCNILNDMKLIIKSKGFMLLNNLRRKSLTFTVKDIKNRHNELFLDSNKSKMKFHTITVCARPVHGVKNVSLIDHWAIKFEGDKYLLTLDYYANSTVIAIIENNNCIGHKIFWYSWCANSKQYFTSRWGTLSKIYLNEEMQGITGECIGHIISKWKIKYSKYCSMTNNCQHFVRDILTVFAFNASKYLSTQFHHRVVEGIIFPSLPFMDELDEQKRMKDIRNCLYKEFEKYYHIKIEEKDEKNNNNNDFVIINDENNDKKEEKYDENNDEILPDINEEMIESEEMYLRFKHWLCDELGMNKYFKLFEKENINQIQFIQYFNEDIIINKVGITNKIHAMFIIKQSKIFNIDNDIKNINVYKNKFKQWLCNDVKLDKYLILFEQNNMNDIRQIHLFDEEILKNIGIKLTPHCKLILEHVNKYNM